MKNNKFIVAVFASVVLMLGLVGCGSENVLTKEEMAVQNAADDVVATLLFDKEMTTRASYNVRKDGYVVIKFDKSVQSAEYNEIVKALRDNPKISGVMAEQMGKEVCPLK